MPVVKHIIMKPTTLQMGIQFFIVCLFSLNSSLEFWGSEIMYIVYDPRETHKFKI